MGYIPIDEVIYGMLKVWMPPEPALFKMAVNSALVLIHKDAERGEFEEREKASERDESDLQ